MRRERVGRRNRLLQHGGGAHGGGADERFVHIANSGGREDGRGSVPCDERMLQELLDLPSLGEILLQTTGNEVGEVRRVELRRPVVHRNRRLRHNSFDDFGKC